jgi:sugar (pentulose or hexulose) kinase
MNAARIGIVGGVERALPLMRSIAAARGCEVEYHPGHMNGQGGGRLRAMVERVQVVVIVTEVNSHAAMWQARDCARRLGRPLHIVRKFGSAQLKALLAA